MAIGIGAKINHPSFGEGVIFGMDDSKFKIYFKDIGEKELSKDYDGYELLEEATIPDNSISLEDVTTAVENVFEQYYDVTRPIELGDRWDGGTMILRPGEDNLKEKEIPIETFFHKIVMLRDRLRVLEQSINSHKKLSDEDKVNMQQYVTRMYGSLTTFNVLFRSREDWFVGESSKEN